MKTIPYYKWLPLLGSQFEVYCPSFWCSTPPLCGSVWQWVAIQYLSAPLPPREPPLPSPCCVMDCTQTPCVVCNPIVRVYTKLQYGGRSKVRPRFFNPLSPMYFWYFKSCSEVFEQFYEWTIHFILNWLVFKRGMTMTYFDWICLDGYP